MPFFKRFVEIKFFFRKHHIAHTAHSVVVVRGCGGSSGLVVPLVVIVVIVVLVVIVLVYGVGSGGVGSGGVVRVLFVVLVMM